MTFSGIVFDLDGTLVDSESILQKAGIAAFAAQGISVDLPFMHALIGKDFQAEKQIIRARIGTFDETQLSLDWDRHARAMMAKELLLKPGAMAVIQHLTGAQIPFAIATSSGAESAARKLKRTGLDAWVATVVSRDDVTHAKPDPEPYLLAASRLGLDPATCLAVEDTPTGIASAKAAGMTTLMVPDILPATEAADHLADTLTDGFAALGLMDLQAR